MFLCYGSTDWTSFIHMVHGWLLSNCYLTWSLCLQDAPHLGVTLTSHMTLIAHSLFWDTQNTPPSFSTHTQRPDNDSIHPFALSVSSVSLSFSLSLSLFLRSHQLFINTVKVKNTKRITSVPSQPLWPGSAPVVSSFYSLFEYFWRSSVGTVFCGTDSLNQLVMWECRDKWCWPRFTALF